MESVQNEFIKFYFEDDILKSKYLKPTIINLENAKNLIDLRHVISKNEKQYWCYDISLLSSMEKSGRDYAEIHGQDFLHACAVVTKSHITKFIFNIFVQIKRPKIPFRSFNDEAKAVAWLLELKKSNK
ncbi:MAG: hypothetical protein HYR91_12195 [Flavobacteriia bacterium]|nr:hypothetical protein [Flavobacteriia bacterium]